MNNRTHSTVAFSLVEVTLALGVAAFCLIAVFGLLPIGLKTDQGAIRQTTANGILSAIVADLRATPLTRTTSNLFTIDFSKSQTTLCCDGDGRCWHSSGGSGGGDGAEYGEEEEEGGGSGTQCANAIFLATVTFSGSGEGDDGVEEVEEEESEDGGSNRTASFVDVKVTWPYSAAAGGGDGEKEGGGDKEGGGSAQPAPAGIVETFVGLDRNGSVPSGD
jgi:hypothetical protein